DARRGARPWPARAHPDPRGRVARHARAGARAARRPRPGRNRRLRPPHGLAATSRPTAGEAVIRTHPANASASPAASGAPSYGAEPQRSRRKNGSSTIGRNVCTAVDTGTTTVAALRWNAVMLTIVATTPIARPNAPHTTAFPQCPTFASSPRSFVATFV